MKRNREVFVRRLDVQGHRRVSDVTVTHADGSVEIVPAYSHKEALAVVEAGEARKRTNKTS